MTLWKTHQTCVSISPPIFTPQGSKRQSVLKYVRSTLSTYCAWNKTNSVNKLLCLFSSFSNS